MRGNFQDGGMLSVAVLVRASPHSSCVTRRSDALVLAAQACKPPFLGAIAGLQEAERCDARLQSKTGGGGGGGIRTIRRSRCLKIAVGSPQNARMLMDDKKLMHLWRSSPRCDKNGLPQGTGTGNRSAQGGAQGARGQEVAFNETQAIRQLSREERDAAATAAGSQARCALACDRGVAVVGIAIG